MLIEHTPGKYGKKFHGIITNKKDVIPRLNKN